MDDLIHCTSHTLQLLIEYDPVRQRLDRLRLGSPRTHLGAPATSRMRLSSPSNAVLERTESVEDSSLKRRSLRCVSATQIYSPRLVVGFFLDNLVLSVQAQQQHLQVARAQFTQRAPLYHERYWPLRVSAVVQQLLSSHLPAV